MSVNALFGQQPRFFSDQPLLCWWTFQSELRGSMTPNPGKASRSLSRGLEMARLESVRVPLGACVPSSTSSAPVTTVTSRHSALVRLTHWITVISVIDSACDRYRLKRKDESF